MDDNKNLYCLRSPECPDIVLTPGDSLNLGRGPLTRISDTRVSRHHVSVILHHKGKDGAMKIEVCQLGPNHSVINKKPVYKGETSHLALGQSFELLEGQYKFKFIETKTSGSQTMEKDIEHNKILLDSKDKLKKGHWSNGLLSSMNDPEYVVSSTDSVVIIKDKYPKAKHHFLILPKKKINNLSCIAPEDLELLKHMEEEAKNLTSKYQESEFRIGYHCEPSMSQVHLHVISTDFVSTCLKHKKHWNSFNTNYFVPSSVVINKIETDGGYLGDKDLAKQYLDTPLRCNHCSFTPVNFPELKKHLLSHSK